MAKSERAKALEAQQKAELKALKAKKKNSTDPADWGRWRQIVETYKATSKLDPQLPWILLGAFAIPFVFLTALGIILVLAAGWHWVNLIMMVVLGIMTGILVALLLFTRRAEASALKRYVGQKGAGEVALRMLGKKWEFKSPVTATRQMDIVHRAVGPGGLLLIGEGEPTRVRGLLLSEAKRHQVALYEMKPITIVMGEGEGQISLTQLPRHIKKLPKTLDKVQIAEIKRRLTALDAKHQQVPMPKGPMPTSRGSRRALRGR